MIYKTCCRFSFLSLLFLQFPAEVLTELGRCYSRNKPGTAVKYLSAAALQWRPGDSGGFGRMTSAAVISIQDPHNGGERRRECVR